MKYRLIDAEKTHHGVSLLARVLGVSRQGYYAWKTRGPFRRARQDAALTETIVKIHARSRCTYGAPRVHAELREDFGVRVGPQAGSPVDAHCAVEGVHRRRRRGLTRRDPAVVPPHDLVNHTLTGSVADCFDNAVTESFFATLETELLDRHHLATRAQAKADCFDFIEGFYNPRRRHSSLGMLSPAEYERRQAQPSGYAAA